VTAGQVGIPPAPKGQDFQFTVDVQGRLSTPEEFGNIIVKSEQGSGGRILRLKDIARVELGAQTYSSTFNLNGSPAPGSPFSSCPTQTPSTSPIACAPRWRAQQGLPPGPRLRRPFEHTGFVKTSINEVFMTLIEAGALVLIVIMIFLQDWRAMLVPATTIR